MAEEDKPEKKKPEKTPEQIAKEQEKQQLEERKVFNREVQNLVEQAEYMKRLSDAQAIDVDVKMKILTDIKNGIRALYGVPKPAPPAQPAYAPPAPAATGYTPPQPQPNLPGAQPPYNPNTR